MRPKTFGLSCLRISFSGFAALIFLFGCGGTNSGSNSNQPPPSVSVSVSPNTASLSVSGAQSFTAAVSNDSSNAGVTWSIGSGAGTLSASTLTGVTYTAPSTISATTAVTLTATSKTDTTKTASAAITLNPSAPPPIITSVAASCILASVQTGQTSQCTATVTGTGSYSSTVTWSAGGVAGGNSTVGTISSAGVYTAPSTVPATNPVTITATSTEDTTQSGSASVTVTTASPGDITISALSENSATPFDPLTVTGTGFSNGTAAISVLFTPENGDPPLMIPVSSSTATSLQLMVPAFLAQATGAFSAETVDVQVVAFSSTTTYLSNTIKGIPVSALPQVAGTAPVGAMTAAALSATLNMSVSAENLGAGNSALANISADLAQLDSDIYPLIDAINIIVTDPTQTVNLTAANGTTIILNEQMLAQSDQYLQALLAAVVSQASIPAATSTSCAAPSGNSAFDANLCSVQLYMQALAALGPSPALTPNLGLHPARGNSRPMLTITKPDAEAMAFFANLTFGALAEACDPIGGAAIYGIGGAPIVTTFIMSLAEGGEVPTNTELAGELGKGVLSVAADSGIPGISTAVELVQGFKDVATYQPPQKGVLVSSGIATFLPGGITYLDPNTGAPSTLLQISSAPDGATFDSTSLVVAPGTTYTLSLTTNGSGAGSITTFPSESSFPTGTAVEVNEVANASSTFTGWGGACTGTGACSVTMNSNQSVSATFTGGVTDWATPSISLGSVGGCAGGTVSGTINIEAAPGVTWTAVNNINVGQAVAVISPTSGTGSGIVTISITVPPQTVSPGGSCGSTYSNTYNDSVPFVFSDGTNQYTNVTWIYVLLN